MNILALKTLLDWVAIATSSDVTHGRPGVYPSLANGVTATSPASAWDNSGTIVEIFDNTVFDVEIHISDLVVNLVSGADEFQATLYYGESGSEQEFACVKFSTPATASRQVLLDINRRLPRNTRLSVKLASASASSRTADFSAHYRSFK